jgi:hypothetical protein
MARRSARVLGVVGPALVALVLTHSLVFLVRYGSAYGEALAHSGHNVAWTVAVVSSTVIGVGLALAGLLQLRRLTAIANATPSRRRSALSRTFDRTDRGPVGSDSGPTGPVRSPAVSRHVTGDERAWLRQASAVGSNAGSRNVARPGAIDSWLGLIGPWLGFSSRLTATTAVLLTIQENIERAGVGLPLPGASLLLSRGYPWAGLVVVAVGLAVGFVVALFRWRRDVLVARIREARRVSLRSVLAEAPASFEQRPAASVLGRAQGLRAPPRGLAV